MKSAGFLFFAAAAEVSAQTLWPRMPPTVTTSDPWQCATQNVTSLVSLVAPTGALQTALVSYASSLVSAQSCTLTGTARINCPYPDKSKWCSFTTLAPTSVLAEYQSYGSANRAIWTTRSASASSVCSECPYAWWNAIVSAPAAGVWLTQGIIHQECWYSAWGKSSSMATSTKSGTATSTKSATVTSSTKSTSTAVTPSSGANGSSKITSSSGGSKPSSTSSSKASSSSGGGSTTTPHSPMRT